MTTQEAIRHLDTYSSTNGSGLTTQDQHEEAKRMAIEALSGTDTNVGTNDLISRQAAIETALAYLVEYCGAAFNEDMQRILKERLDSLPSVQPEQNKNGKWIYGEHDVAMCDGYRCDKCGFFVPWDYRHKSIDYIKDYHFCPNCGAKMENDGGEPG